MGFSCKREADGGAGDLVEVKIVSPWVDFPRTQALVVLETAAAGPW